jgi:hypothetical protein
VLHPGSVSLLLEKCRCRYCCGWARESSVLLRSPHRTALHVVKGRAAHSGHGKQWLRRCRGEGIGQRDLLAASRTNGSPSASGTSACPCGTQDGRRLLMGGPSEGHWPFGGIALAGVSVRLLVLLWLQAWLRLRVLLCVIPVNLPMSPSVQKNPPSGPQAPAQAEHMHGHKPRGGTMMVRRQSSTRAVPLWRRPQGWWRVHRNPGLALSHQEVSRSCTFTWWAAALLAPTLACAVLPAPPSCTTRRLYILQAVQFQQHEPPRCAICGHVGL